jgi:hypothetical protein
MLERSLDIASKLQATSSGVRLLMLLRPLLLLMLLPLFQLLPPLSPRLLLICEQARHVQTINEKKQAMNANLTKTQVSTCIEILQFLLSPEACLGF